jgi:hypothetical protein
MRYKILQPFEGGTCEGETVFYGQEIELEPIGGTTLWPKGLEPESQKPKLFDSITGERTLRLNGEEFPFEIPIMFTQDHNGRFIYKRIEEKGADSIEAMHSHSRDDGGSTPPTPTNQE